MARLTSAQQETDRIHMARCLELARKYAGRTSPNPIVGCVIVDRRGTVIAEGAHRAYGKAHAEAVALKRLGGKARGATLYVNLEPCRHQGKTPPCAPAVIASGVARVVIGLDDPIPGHGGGAAMLRRAGIAVTTNVLATACARANLPFLTWAEQGRPAFILKAAMTLDGKIATVAGKSKWITGDLARAHVHGLRNTYDAVMVGVNTVLADDPWLTCHGIAGLRDPHKLILDSQLRTPPSSHVLSKATAVRVIFLCGERASAAKERALVAKGAEVWRTPQHANGTIDMHIVARALAAQQITSVLVEGGGEVHAYMLEHDLCDQLMLYVAPKVVGGPAKSWVGGKGRASLAAAWRFDFDDEVYTLGVDKLFVAVPSPRKVPADLGFAADRDD